MSGEKSGTSWLTPFMAMLVALFGGAAVMNSGGKDSGGKESTRTTSASQNVTFDGTECPDRLARIRAPLYDFLGIGLKPSTCAADRDVPLEKCLPEFDLSFLIVTVADPVDSSVGYMFDPALDSIQKALGANPDDRWVYGGCYLPWQAYKDRVAADPKIAHKEPERWYRDEPGVLLYRSSPKPSGAGCPASDSPPDSTQTSRPRDRLLLIYLIGESPTLGIHRRSIDLALTEIHNLRRRKSQCEPRAYGGIEEPPNAVRIVGPMFTGSAYSLREALRTHRTHRKFQCQYHIITGSATAISPDFFNGVACFTSTVCHWDDMKRSIERHVHKAPIAWLVESGTGFGATASDSGQRRDDLTFSYPVHISRVRKPLNDRIADLKQQQTVLNPLGVTSRLPFDAVEAARDVPPPQTPNMTVPTVELVLEEILDTIRRKDFRYVAIAATDHRDVLFLAEMLKLRCPMVQLIIPESDLIHTHPEYRAALKGALIASSYPLFPEGLEWCSPGLSHWNLLSNQIYFGIYNAMLLQRHFQRCPESVGATEPTRVSRLDSVPKGTIGLCPGQGNTRRPAVWLQRIGYSGVYPVTVDSRLCTDYAKVLTDPTAADAIASRYPVGLWFPIVLLAVAIWGAVIVAQFVPNNEEAIRAAELIAPLKIAGCTTGSSHPTYRSLLLAGILTTLTGATLFVLAIPSCSAPFGGLLSMTALSGTWILGCAIIAGVLSVLTVRSRTTDAVRWGDHILFSAAGVVVGIASWWGVHQIELILSGASDSLQLKCRLLSGSNLLSGVSLVIPTLCGSAAWIAMCYGKLRQAYLVREAILMQTCRVVEPTVNEAWAAALLCGAGWRMRTVVIAALGLLYLASVGYAAWIATVDSAKEGLRFWWSFWVISVGYFVWWLFAVELVAMYRAVRQVVKRVTEYDPLKVSAAPPLVNERQIYGLEFCEIHKLGFSGFERMFLGSGPREHDAVMERIEFHTAESDRDFDRERESRSDRERDLRSDWERERRREALLLFRNVHFRMVLLGNQFALLGAGCVLLYVAVESYPFTSVVIFRALGLFSMLALVCYAVWCYMKLDRDENLSRMLGTVPNAVEWNWSLIKFAGGFLLLGAFTVLFQVVPESFEWLGSLLGPISRLSR